MKLQKWKDALQEKLPKNRQTRLLILLFLAGLVLYLLCRLAVPEEQKTAPEPVPQTATLESELETLLSRLPGAGKVRVILSLEQETRTVYQTDETGSESGSGSSSSSHTVITSGEGLVQTAYAPVYRGAAVGCEGADSAALVLKIKAAVSCLTGLRNDQITVIPMK